MSKWMYYGVNKEIIGVISGDFIARKIRDNETVDLEQEDIEEIYQYCGYSEEDEECLD